MRRRPGRFIVLEGIDGAGTTTQVRRLASRLRKDGYRVRETCEPTDRPVGRLIRQALKRHLALTDETLALLFAADRVDHLRSEVGPSLQRGEVVLCDRYLLSSLAYQGISVGARWVQEINRFAMAPDLTLFIEVDPRTAARRRARRGGVKELFDATELQERIAKQYQTMIRQHRVSHRVVRIDGGQSIEEVTAEALGVVLRAIGRTSGGARATMRA